MCQYVFGWESASNKAERALIRSSLAAASLEVLEGGHNEELLDEELGVEHGDVRGAADEGVGVGGQRVVDVVPHQVDSGAVHDRTQDAGDHLAVRRAYIAEEKRVLDDHYFSVQPC